MPLPAYRFAAARLSFCCCPPIVLLLLRIAVGAVGDEVCSLTQTDDSLADDMFALITPDHAFICCNTITFESIKHLILCWPGLHLTVTAPPTSSDPDAGEDQKAAAFIYAGSGRLSTRRSGAVVSRACS